MRVFDPDETAKHGGGGSRWSSQMPVALPLAAGQERRHAGATAASPNTCLMRAQPSLDDLIFALVRRFGFLPLPGKNGTDTTGSDALFNVSNTYCRQNGHTL